MATYYMDYVNGDDGNNGSSWALAKKTIQGFTAAILGPGDIIRIAKSPAPVSLGTTGAWNGTGTVTERKIVTLGAAQNVTIELCETAWTASTDVTATTSATRKEGSYAASLAIVAGFTTGKVAYKATGTLNLSAYQKLSFWIQNNAAIASATVLKVVLCSDTAGDTIVDTFWIPAIPSTARFLPLTIAREGGGNLGASIASIAVYANSDPGTITLLLDDFIACTTDGLNLQSLISKNSAEQGGTEGWYGIQSINGVTVLLDNDTNTLANAGRGYSGTTETVTTYKRETIKTDLAAAATTEVQTVQASGSFAVGNIEFQGGWNTSTTVQEGETFFDGLNGNGYGIYLLTKSHITFNYLNVCRYNYGVCYSTSSNNTITTLSNANNNTYGVVYSSASNNNTITSLSNANNNSYGVYYSASNKNTITTLSNANNNTYGVYYSTSSNNTITTLSNANNNAYGVRYDISSNNTIKSLSTSGNGTTGVYNDRGINYLFNALIAEPTEVSGYTSFGNSRIFSNKHDQTTDNHWIFTDGGTINSQTTVRHTASGIAWKLAITSANRASNYPLTLSITKIAVAANALVTVKVWVYKDSAAGVAAKLVCRGKQIAGVDNDVVATAANVLQTWEELTITFTPTEAGVVEIEGWGYYVSALSSVYFDDMTISQA